MVANIVNNISLSPQDIANLAIALKPNQWQTILATALTAYASAGIAILLYNLQRKDKIIDDKKAKDDEKIKNLNILLLNLFQCVENQKDNLFEVKSYQKETEETYKKAKLYSFKDECDIEAIKKISEQIIVDLPEISYDLNRLKNDLYWAKRYREQREENAIKLGFDFYIERLNCEEQQEIMIIKRVITICLVIYDYATNLYPKKRILKITEKVHIAQIWEYLIDDTNFNEINSFYRLQYEFKNAAIKEWFFKTLKNSYLESCKGRDKAE